MKLTMDPDKEFELAVLAYARKLLKLDQKQMARLMKCNQSTISRMESGHREISERYRAFLEHMLNRSLEKVAEDFVHFMNLAAQQFGRKTALFIQRINQARREQEKKEQLEQTEMNSDERYTHRDEDVTSKVISMDSYSKRSASHKLINYDKFRRDQCTNTELFAEQVVRDDIGRTRKDKKGGRSFERSDRPTIRQRAGGRSCFGPANKGSTEFGRYAGCGS